VGSETVNSKAIACASRSASRHRTVENFPSAFGLVLRDQRMTRALSQEALAYAAGLDRKYTGRVERGESVPSLITMYKLAAALSIPLSKLIERAEQSAGGLDETARV
jgi:transcriptional regulator with XRE-family HTH domain